MSLRNNWNEILVTLVFKDFQKLSNLLKWLFKPFYKNVLKTSGLLVSKLNKSETGKNKAGITWGFCYQKKKKTKNKSMPFPTALLNLEIQIFLFLPTQAYNAE